MESQPNIKYVIDDSIVQELKDKYGIDAHAEIKKAIDQCSELDKRIKNEN